VSRGPRRVDGIREQTGDPQNDRSQRTALDLARQMQRCPFLLGTAKRVRLVVGTPRTIAHKLGTPAGLIVLHYDSNGPVVNIRPTIAASQVLLDQDYQMSVIADATCTAYLWFYPLPVLELE
jgi:hypothetical protein